MSEQFEFVDRYSATGMPYPDPATVCLGQCEGMGCVPVQKPRDGDCRSIEPERAELLELWDFDHAANCNPWGVIKVLWRYREFWFWRSVGRDIWRWIRGKGFCDGWHFVTCPDCKGTGKREDADVAAI